LVLLVCLVSIRAAAQEPPADEPTNERTPGEPPPPPAALPTAQPPSAPEPVTANPEVKPVADPAGGPWHMDASGYFRTPMALGISSRQGPDDMPTPDKPAGGPSKTQISYGPNRTVDANYYSFAYTRLQEQDWAEVFIHAKKKHVDAAIGWMGYWYQAVGFRNPDAAWAPGLAYLALDTDFEAAGVKPNIAVTMGAFWPSFGYFEKYDTYTLGRFRQLGEQLKLTVPLSPDLTAAVVEGFGTGRDGSWNPGAPAFYGAITAIDLITWANVQVKYKNYVDVGLHYNTQWTADPNLTQQSSMGDKSYSVVQAAHLTVLGAEANLRAPYLGHLWISPSFISVRNGWALASSGTEVMHSLGGSGVATNYMAFTNNPAASTGSGSMINLGFLYENTLSSVLGNAPGSVPELTLSIFGLLADARLDLPAASSLTQKSIKQLKYGADLTFQYLTWLAFMLRYDAVNYDLDNPGYVFASITPRVIVSSHFLSSERIYIQYSRYIYGDKMVLAGTWPWGAPLVAGSNILQAGPYVGMKPDENVIKLQADIAF
jgi:hypothetical protein